MQNVIDILVHRKPDSDQVQVKKAVHVEEQFLNL